MFSRPQGLRAFLAAFLAFLILLSSLPAAVPNYTDAGGYPAPWPAQLATQAYTSLAQPQSDLTGNPDGSKGAAPQGPADFSSGPASDQPSFFYFADGTNLFFRIRIAGPPTALSGSGQPFTSVTWNFLLDTDGDGFKEFIIEVDGTNALVQPDDIVISYDNANSQRFAIGLGNVWVQDTVRHPTLRSGDGADGEPGTSGAWDRDPDAYVWDFTRTRVVQIDRTRPPESQNSEYFIDLQVPLAALDARAVGGPVIGPLTPFALIATTSNSNTDPTQKDVIFRGDFALGDVPLPGGDPVDGSGNTYLSPIIGAVTATSCPSPIILTARVVDTTQVVNGATADTIASVKFEYAEDENANGLPDDSGPWVLIGDGARTATLGIWRFSWNAAVVPTGKYIVRAIARDNQGNTTTSTNQPVIYPDGVFAVFNHTCGIVPPAINGRVFIDNGALGGIANDGVLNGSEPGLAGAIVKLTDAAGTTVYRTATSDAAGNYRLRIPISVTAGSALRIVEVNPPNYLSTGASVGNTGGVYNRAADTIAFTLAASVSYTGVNFGEVGVNTLAPDNQQSGLPGTVLIYPHRFVAGSAGVVTFSTTSLPNPTLAGWGQTLARDVNCDGKLDAGEPAITGPITVVAGEVVCVLVKEFIPITAPLGAQDRVTLTADFSYTGSAPALTATHSRIDLTTVGNPTTAGLTLQKLVDKATARPGEPLIYTITYGNNSTEPLSAIVIHDATPAFSRFTSAANGPLPPGLTAVVLTAPAAGASGAIRWTFTGTLAPGGTGTVSFTVTLEQ